MTKQLWLAVGLVTAFRCSQADAADRPDVLSEWTDVALTSLAAAKQPSYTQSRTMAMVHLALFEAINGPAGPYASYLEARAPKVMKASFTAPSDSLREATAAVAAHGVLAALFPDQKSTFDSALEKSLGGSATETAIAEGRRIAAAVLEARAQDGAEAANTVRPLTRPGVYIPTAMPVGSTWGEVKPWILKSGSQFRPSAPPALSSETWAKDYNEIKSLGAKVSSGRSAAQTEAARYWAMIGPPSWIPIVRDLASRPGRTLVQNARLYALVSLAAADSYIAIFDAKYAFSFWRPITAIRNGDQDGNGATTRDPAWEPLIETPMHPEYPCAHCINSAAVGGVLEAEFGAGDIGTFQMTSLSLPGVTHRWNRIQDYLDEVANARIWGGIHYRNSAKVGTAMGRSIAKVAVTSVLKPR